MTQKQVDEVFRDYQQITGRCAYLRIEIERLRQAIDQENAAAEPLDFMRVSASFVVAQKGKNIGDPTGRAAQMLADGEPTEQARRDQRRMKTLTAELEDKLAALACVDAWLQGLDNTEQFILKRRMMEHLTWERVAKDYEALFGESRSVDTIKRVNRLALQKVYVMAG